MSPNFRTFNELFEYKKNPHTALLFNIVKDMITILIIWCLFRLFGYLVFGIDKLLPIRTLPEDMKLPPFSTSNVYFIVCTVVCHSNLYEWDYIFTFFRKIFSYLLYHFNQLFIFIIKNHPGIISLYQFK